MALNTKYFIVFIVYLARFAEGTQTVPVYIWGTNTVSDHVPALLKIKEDSFNDYVQELLKNDTFVVVYEEKTLSSEDFHQRGLNRELAFPKLGSFDKITYKPHVQNPIKVLKHLNRKVTELSVDSFLENRNVPKNNILLINLEDAKDDEERYEMLRRHDSQIALTYDIISKVYDNVLAIYTAHHTSWIAASEVTSHKRRSLLAEEGATEEAIPINRTLFSVNNTILMYLGNWSTFINTSEAIKFTINDFKPDMSPERNSESLNFTLDGDKKHLTFQFTFGNNSYWQLKGIKVKMNDNEGNFVLNSSIFAPMKFSYHCGDLNLSLGPDSYLHLPGFQVQPFLFNSSFNTSRFGDAYDCIGFTTVPIWSGLFVTLILLVILTFGLTMMMDIKTMDRFDDAKGKTITINASE